MLMSSAFGFVESLQAKQGNFHQSMGNQTPIHDGSMRLQIEPAISKL